MYTHHKVLLSLGFALAYAFGVHVSCGQAANVKTALLTLISILFGFTINAVILLCGSDFMRKQANIVSDGKGILMNNAQRIVSYMKCSIYSELAAVVMIIASYLYSTGWMWAYVLKPLICGASFLVLALSLLILRIITKMLLTKGN